MFTYNFVELVTKKRGKNWMVGLNLTNPETFEKLSSVKITSDDFTENDMEYFFKILDYFKTSFSLTRERGVGRERKRWIKGIGFYSVEDFENFANDLKVKVIEFTIVNLENKYNKIIKRK